MSIPIFGGPKPSGAERKNLAISARTFKWLLGVVLSLKTLAILGGFAVLVQLFGR
jgi:hypothetical protein